MFEFDNIGEWEEPPSLLSVIFGLCLILILGVALLVIMAFIPLAIVHYFDVVLLGSIIPAYGKILISVFGSMYCFICWSRISNNPIDWYISLRRPLMTADKSSDPVEVLDWVQDNITGKRLMVANRSYRFLRTSDAMAFKIRWS